MTATRIHNSLSELGEGISGTTDDTALHLSGVPNAVNYIELTNSATGSEPIISAAGSDTDIDIILTPKGNGQIVANSIILGALAGNATTATTAGIVTTAAQPNITSVGTLTGFTSTGIDDNSTSNQLVLNDTQVRFAQDVHAGFDGTTYSTGLSGFYAYDTNATNYSFIRARDSAGTGPWLMHVIGSVAKFQVDSDGDISVVRNITASGSLSCGAFTSTGIDDNSTAEKLQISDAGYTIGGASTGNYYLIRGHATVTGWTGLSSTSSVSLGANILMYGDDASSALANEFLIRQSSVNRIKINDATSGSDINLLNDAGGVAFTIDGAAGHAYAANGIRIGADAAANLLDDYEEGTWTPALAFGLGEVGITYTTQTGTYTKIGDTVIATGEFLLTSKGTSTGGASLSGLPFTMGDLAAGSSIDWPVVSNYLGNMSGLTGVVSGYGTAGGTRITFKQSNATGSHGALTDGSFTNTTYMRLIIIYNI